MLGPETCGEDSNPHLKCSASNMIVDILVGLHTLPATGGERIELFPVFPCFAFTTDFHIQVKNG